MEGHAPGETKLDPDGGVEMTRADGSQDNPPGYDELVSGPSCTPDDDTSLGEPVPPERFTGQRTRQDASHKLATINRCAFSPDPERHSIVAVCDENGSVTLRDLDSRADRLEADHHRGSVTRSPDDSIRFFKHSAKKDTATCLSFSYDGTMLAVAGGRVDESGVERRVRVYLTKQKVDEPELNRIVKAYTAEHIVYDISFAPTGELAYGGSKQPLRIVCGPTEAELRRTMDGTLEALAPESSSDLESSSDTAATIKARHKNFSFRVPVCDEEQYVTVGADGEVHQNQKTAQLTWPTSYSISFSPCGDFFAFVTRRGVLTVLARVDRNAHDGHALPWLNGRAKPLYQKAETFDTRSTVVTSGCCRFSPKPWNGQPVLLALVLMDYRLIMREVCAALAVCRIEVSPN